MQLITNLFISMHHKFLIPVFFLLLFACGKEKPTDKPPIQLTGNGVFITNEGNFLYGNASVSYYQKSLDELRLDLFSDANQLPLGDVCQSLFILEDKIFVVVNNSGKVEVVNKKDFKKSHTITGFESPRYFLPVSTNKAYVTDLYQNGVSVVNLQTFQKTGIINIPGWTENLEISNGNVFITNKTNSKLYVLDAQSDQIKDSIQLVQDPNSMVKDKFGKIWVLCSGSTASNEGARLYKVSPITLEIELELSFPNASDRASKLCMNGERDALFFYKNGIYTAPITLTSLPDQALITGSWGNFYGMGIDPLNGDIYVSDALDFVQRGRIFRYKNNGEFSKTFLAGIIPGHFYFD